MRFTCPSCSKSYRLSRDRLGAAGGAKIRCPNCKTLVRVHIGEGDKLISQVASASVGRSTAKPTRPASSSPSSGAAPKAAATARAPVELAPAARTAVWHVAVKQQAKGPLAIADIQALIDGGEIDVHCLAWKKGLVAWKKIEELPALQAALRFGGAAVAGRGEPRGTLKTGAAHVPTDAGDSPTVMADIPAAISATRAPTVPGGKAARRKESLRRAASERGMTGDEIELAEARTLRPDRQPKPVRGGAMPRGKAKRSGGRSGGAIQAPAVEIPAAAPPRVAAKKSATGTKSATKSATKAATKSTSVEGPAVNAGNVKKAPEKQASGKVGGVKPTVAKGKAGQQTKKGAPPVANKPAAAPQRAAAGKAKPKTPAKATGESANEATHHAAKAGGAAQSRAFFESGEQLMADVAFDLPDPNKHKPTKEEYANLLQEFSVMFRLDKRSKRQKAGIVVVLTLLVVGVISFGVILYLQGQQRQALIRDSKTILAVFSLPYQTSETVNLSQEADQESAEFGEASTQKARRGTVQSSSLAEKLRAKIRGRRIEQGRTRARHVVAKKQPTFRVRSAAELLGGQMGAAANQAALVGASGKAAKIVSVDMRKEPSRQVLRPLCKGAMPDLRACAKAHAGDAAFKARVAVSRDGKVVGVTATVDGKTNSALSACAFGKMKRKRVDLLKKKASITCSVQ